MCSVTWRHLDGSLKWRLLEGQREVAAASRRWRQLDRRCGVLGSFEAQCVVGVADISLGCDEPSFRSWVFL